MRADLMRKRLILAGAIAIAPALFFVAGDFSVQAQGTAPSTVTAPSAAGKPPAQSLPQAITAEVVGFRTARFGMTDEQVKEAIKRDFDIDAKDVKKLRNDVQKTDILAVQVENLVPGSGTSVVFYIFGYASKKLIHVNVVWGRLAQQTVTPAALVNTGTILQNYFKNLGLATTQGSSTTSQVTLYQGFDEKKRAIQLVLEVSPAPPEKSADPKAADPKAAGAKPAAKPASPTPTPAAKPADAKTPTTYLATSLKLSYIENASTPDIYTIPKGKF